MRYNEKKLVGFVLMNELFIQELCRESLKAKHVTDCKDDDEFEYGQKQKCRNMFICQELTENPVTIAPSLKRSIYDMQINIVKYSNKMKHNVSYIIEKFIWKPSNENEKNINVLSKKLFKKSYGIFNKKSSSMFSTIMNLYSDDEILESKIVDIDNKYSVPPHVIKITIENLPESFVIKSTKLNIAKKGSWVIKMFYEYRRILAVGIMLATIYFCSSIFLMFWAIYVIFKLSEIWDDGFKQEDEV
jgi:hypothetical protein